MTTSDKRPRRPSKTAKSTAAPAPAAAQQADNGVAEGARRKKKLAASGTAAAEAVAAQGAPAPDGPTIKAINVTVTARHHEDRHASIAKAAYFRAEMRGFAPGHEVEDWLAAEEEVDQRLLGEGRAS